MIFAIRNQNEHFLKFALGRDYFGSHFFNEKAVRDEILSQMGMKGKTEFMLNILLFADFAKWPSLDLQQFIDYLEEMCDESHELNRIVLSYNPILTICLACVHLSEIGT